MERVVKYILLPLFLLVDTKYDAVFCYDGVFLTLHVEKLYLQILVNYLSHGFAGCDSLLIDHYR